MVARFSGLSDGLGGLSDGLGGLIDAVRRENRSTGGAGALGLTAVVLMVAVAVGWSRSRWSLGSC